jgi:subtilisin family serine protease
MRASRPARRVGSAAAAAALSAALCVAATAPVSAAPAAATGHHLTGTPVAKVTKADWEKGLRSYFVLADPADVEAAKKAVVDSGGTVFAAYDKIGVVVAHAKGEKFADAVRAVRGVQAVGATRTSDVPRQAYDPPIPKAPTQQQPTEKERLRWDMEQIRADEAWKVTTGSRDVVVGVLDTGVDDQHPDLKENFVAGKSASCAYGRLDRREGAWRDTGSHGTHVAGTIAAAKNGVGVVGVAPGVRIASVRIAEEPTGLFFPENTVCAFMFAGDQRFDVTNNSYYTDPWQFVCPNDVDQAAILDGVRRAVRYAQNRGVLHVAAAGNSDYDLANKTTDSTSPNDSTPIKNRPIGNSCLDIPTEIPGVITVSATGDAGVKASYSNYGVAKIDVAAPGGDPFGGQDRGVYSTVPGGGFGYKAGTSMASPHVAGVVALLASVHPDAGPAELAALLRKQARDVPCPDDDRCTGGKELNSFYGEGEVDAAKAVRTRR